MKKILLSLAMLAAFAMPVAAASDQAGQCPGYNDPANSKTDTNDGSTVLPAGLTICIHASNGNTGLLVTDGTSTLADYIEASGLLNNGGQIPNVSNYVVYPATPSTPPSMAPSTPPSVPPSVTPSVPPSVTPSDEPSGSEPPAVTARPRLTPPPTDTETPRPVAGGVLPFVITLLSIIGLAYLTIAQIVVRRRRRSR